MWNYSIDLEALLTSGFASDLKIIIIYPNRAEEEINAHKIFLQASSPVLDAAIRENGDQFVFENEEPEIVKLMLMYLYTEELDLGEKLLPAMKLYQLATKYEIKDLIEECEDALKSLDLKIEEVLPLFEEGRLSRHNPTIDRTMKYICGNASAILELSDFSNLSLECLIEIIEKDQLIVDKEMEVFDAVYRWGKAECIRQSLDAIDPSTMRTILFKAIKHVRFPLMKIADFQQKVDTKNILDGKEITELTKFLASFGAKKGCFGPVGRFSATPRKAREIKIQYVPTMEDVIIMLLAVATLAFVAIAAVYAHCTREK